jgi:hypothetical protein
MSDARMALWIQRRPAAAAKRTVRWVAVGSSYAMITGS